MVGTPCDLDRDDLMILISTCFLTHSISLLSPPLKGRQCDQIMLVCPLKGQWTTINMFFVSFECYICFFPKKATRSMKLRINDPQ